MPTNAQVGRRFPPTVVGIVTVTFIRYLIQHPRIKWICIGFGLTFLLSPLIWFVVHLAAPDQVASMWPALVFLSSAGLYLLYICALASPDYNVFVAAATEVADRERPARTPATPVPAARDHANPTPRRTQRRHSR